MRLYKLKRNQQQRMSEASAEITNLLKVCSYNCDILNKYRAILIIKRLGKARCKLLSKWNIDGQAPYAVDFNMFISFQNMDDKILID